MERYFRPGMENRSPLIATTLATAMIAMSGCGNDTEFAGENESLFESLPSATPDLGFPDDGEDPVFSTEPESSPEVMLRPSPKTASNEELAEVFGSLWGPKGEPPMPEPSGAASATAEADEDVAASPATPADDEEDKLNEPDSMSASATPTALSSPKTRRYKSGEHIATGSYQTPGGTESLRVEVILQGDEISNVIVIPQSQNETSLKMQKQFAEDIGLFVTGKPLDEVTSLESVNGSSLAPAGFLSALQTIRKNAAL